MSMTRTVSATSMQRQDKKGQQGQDQHQQQRVNWGRDQNGSSGKKSSTSSSVPDSISISRQNKDKGHRLGDGGGSNNSNATSSALAEIYSNWGGGSNNRIGGAEMNQQNQRRDGRQGHGGGAYHQDGGRPGPSHSNNRVPVAPADPRRNQAETEGAGNPRPSIEEYYASNGADFKRLRKNCKVPGQDSCGGSKNKQTVSMDCFRIPVGYTLADIPDIQGSLNRSQDEVPISPAVLLANNSRRERRTVETPKINCDEFIQQMQEKAQRNKKANISEKASKEPDPAPNESLLNGSFPEDSFNEADLILASQQVENEFAANGDTLNQQSLANDIRKRDINGNTKCPNKMSTPISNAPLTSTPLPASNRKPGKEKETPKARSCGLSRMRNKSSGQKSSIFETSNADMSLLSPAQAETGKENEAGTPRKILKFDESPIKHFATDKEISKSGDFFDDDEDDIFSQVEIPGEAMKAPQNAAASNRSHNVTEMDSVLDASDLAAIEQLEGLHCRSTSGESSNSIASESRSSEKRLTRSSTRTTNKTESTGFPDTPTQTSRTRRLGLSLSRTRKN